MLFLSLLSLSCRSFVLRGISLNIGNKFSSNNKTVVDVPFALKEVKVVVLVLGAPALDMEVVTGKVKASKAKANKVKDKEEARTNKTSARRETGRARTRVR